jgi:hypothetical protein
MPHIIVQHTKQVAKFDKGFLLGEVRKNLRDTSKVLSVKHRELLSSDFSFMFLQAGPWDSLIHDIQVIILAHADEARVKPEGRSDALAEMIASAIGQAVCSAIQAHRPTEVTFSVSLHMGEMGYFAGSAKLGDERGA